MKANVISETRFFGSCKCWKCVAKKRDQFFGSCKCWKCAVSKRQEIFKSQSNSEQSSNCVNLNVFTFCQWWTKTILHYWNGYTVVVSFTLTHVVVGNMSKNYHWKMFTVYLDIRKRWHLNIESNGIYKRGAETRPSACMRDLGCWPHGGGCKGAYNTLSHPLLGEKYLNIHQIINEKHGTAWHLRHEKLSTLCPILRMDHTLQCISVCILAFWLHLLYLCMFSSKLRVLTYNVQWRHVLSQSLHFISPRN